jgi:hypothetical protein
MRRSIGTGFLDHCLRRLAKGSSLRFPVAGLAFAFLASCAPVQQHETMDRTAGAETFSSVGDVMVRVDETEDLPNIFGNADIYGRKRNRGFSEVRFMGLSPSGAAVFRRRDVDILTNEDTMNRSGFGSGIVTVQPAGQGVAASGITTQAAQPNVAVLPPDTTEFVLDLSQGHIITLRGKTIEIISADSSGVHYIVR